MHELTLAESLIDLAEDEIRKLSGAKVRTVRLEIGALAAVEPDAMRFCFDVVARGTSLEGVALDIVTVAGRGRCLACGHEIEVLERPALCPDCGGFRVEVTSGAGMRLKELEVE
ncbi:hydrogenase maturation nickel metallochaperone HypA [Xanthobacteraceae bacterium Astr-EGSB]|uniref:hydrogenase maturation nickel metallochaperone HypA n=1 Tax=Astrobacterium formosum TaxID=3069710 RepID=UPI0027B69000|nr:hydrogenase maturation nickel metallochaperone HypA [Xanthobacteraceae bacterium Astr-EGSB]